MRGRALDRSLYLCHDTAAPVKPLIFIHGVSHGAWCWEEYFGPYFRDRGYDAIALDLRGHGQRQRIPLRWIPLSAYVEDVREAVGKLSEPPVVIGHSMGGAIVQRYLASGGAAAAAVLVASATQRGVWGAALRLATTHPLRFAAINATLSFKPFVASPDTFADFFAKSFPRAELERLQPLTQDDSYRAFLDMMLMAFSPPPPSQVPTLVIAGAEDSLFTPRGQRRLADYHGAEFELFEGLGHDLMLETGWRQVADRIESFLEALEPVPA